MIITTGNDREEEEEYDSPESNLIEIVHSIKIFII